ncbi:hypothetical protein [Haliscomenobacter sp.]|uniref:hypothetical protein n=1 Tax=Haliscomenobacter sp. TaxID=2717303 RepID=UPI003364E96C
MTIQKQLLLDIQKIEDYSLLNQLYHYVQLMKKISTPQQENKSAVLEFAGKIDDVEAEELKLCIETEFSVLEGEW